MKLLILFGIILVPVTSCHIAQSSDLRLRPQALLNSALIEAAKRGNVVQTNALLKKNANPNQGNMQKATALHFASYFGHVTIAELLVNAQAQVDAQNASSQDFTFPVISNKHGGVTPLMLACSRGNAAIVSYLLKKGAAVNQQDDVGQTALTYTILSNGDWPNKKLSQTQKNIVLMLLAQGANPYIEDDYGLHPLYYYERIAELVSDGLRLVVQKEAAQLDKLYMALLDYKQ
ncbi:hypothetical protein Noda2021_10670 [Candidatus Dependentiae bacterium Noda2021]|nr:hypothetical protein Noda2021_10670 [Candidatus Dependentiae bacterium Noda2021]